MCRCPMGELRPDPSPLHPNEPTAALIPQKCNGTTTLLTSKKVLSVALVGLWVMRNLMFL